MAEHRGGAGPDHVGHHPDLLPARQPGQPPGQLTAGQGLARLRAGILGQLRGEPHHVGQVPDERAW